MTKNMQNIIKQIEKDFELKIKFKKFSKKDEHRAYFSLITKNVIISRDVKSPVKIAMLICHELGHAYCVKYKKFPVFHQIIPPPKTKKKLEEWIKVYKRTMLRAERYVDNLGDGFYKQYFNFKTPYYKAYHETKHIKEFMEWYYNEFFNRLKKEIR